MANEDLMKEVIKKFEEDKKERAIKRLSILVGESELAKKRLRVAEEKINRFNYETFEEDTWAYND